MPYRIKNGKETFSDIFLFYLRYVRDQKIIPKHYTHRYSRVIIRRYNHFQEDFAT